MGQQVIVIRYVQGPVGGGGSGTVVGLTGDVVASGVGTVTATVEGFWGRPVASTAPTNGQVYTYNSTTSTWAPAASGSGLNQLTGDVLAGPGTGSQGAVVDGLRSIPLATSMAAPSYGQIVQYGTGTSSTQWTNASPTWLTTISGDVVVTGSTLTSTGLQVTATVEGFWGRPVASTAPTNGQVYTYSTGTSTWIPATPSGGGSSGSLTGDVDTGAISGVTAATVVGIQTIAVPVPSVNGTVLTFSSAAYVWSTPITATLIGDVTTSTILSGSTTTKVVGLQGIALPAPSSNATFLEYTTAAGGTLSWATVGAGTGITQLTQDVLAGAGSGSQPATIVQITGTGGSCTIKCNALDWGSTTTPTIGYTGTNLFTISASGGNMSLVSATGFLNLATSTVLGVGSSNVTLATATVSITAGGNTAMTASATTLVMDGGGTACLQATASSTVIYGDGSAILTGTASSTAVAAGSTSLNLVSNEVYVILGGSTLLLLNTTTPETLIYVSGAANPFLNGQATSTLLAYGANVTTLTLTGTTAILTCNTDTILSATASSTLIEGNAGGSTMTIGTSVSIGSQSTVVITAASGNNHAFYVGLTSQLSIDGTYVNFQNAPSGTLTLGASPATFTGAFQMKVNGTVVNVPYHT